MCGRIASSQWPRVALQEPLAPRRGAVSIAVQFLRAGGGLPAALASQPLAYDTAGGRFSGAAPGAPPPPQQQPHYLTGAGPDGQAVRALLRDESAAGRPAQGAQVPVRCKYL